MFPTMLAAVIHDLGAGRDYNGAYRQTGNTVFVEHAWRYWKFRMMAISEPIRPILP